MKNLLKLFCISIFLIHLIIFPQYKYITYKFNSLKSKDVTSFWVIDFSQYYSAALTLREGKDFYNTNLMYKLGEEKGAFNSGMDYLYPPFFLFLVVPLTFLPFWLAKMLWLFLNQSLIIVIILISLRMFRIKNKDVFWLSLGFMGIFNPLFLELRLGQADLIMSLFLYLGIYLIIKKENFLGSMLYAISCCLKLSPLAFIIYFVKKRLMKLTILSLIIIIAITIFSTVAVKKNINNDYFSKTFPGLISGSKFMELNCDKSELWYIKLNQSLGSLIEKTFFLAWGIEGYRDNILVPKILSLILRAIFFIFILALLKSNSLDNNIFLWEVSIFITTILLVNTGSFVYHFSVLILPLCGVIGFLVENYRKISISFYILFLASFTLMGFRLGYYYVPLDNIFLFWGSSKLYGLILFLWLLFKIYKRSLKTI
ncbi:MAG: DUF2029 domain-containing protein [Candidatus Omnitrophica bacterium]|jgi:hypothetical protein|nr:DUF2029 domain-containing protein [Candidatus Omnitrophota bacterium]